MEQELQIIVLLTKWMMYLTAVAGSTSGRRIRMAGMAWAESC